MDDYVYIWVRYRHGSSASAGTWQWQEFHFPKAVTKTKAAMTKYFRENYASELVDDHGGSEHYRGITWDDTYPKMPKDLLIAEVRNNQARIDRLMQRATRFKVQQGEAPERNLAPRLKNACIQWPGCGCMSAGRRKDCHKPYRPRWPSRCIECGSDYESFGHYEGCTRSGST